MVFSPVGLHEHAVDMVDTDDLFAVSDGFEHGGDAQVARSAQQAFAGAYDEGDGVITEGIMTQSDGVELGILSRIMAALTPASLRFRIHPQYALCVGNNSFQQNMPACQVGTPFER